MRRPLLLLIGALVFVAMACTVSANVGDLDLDPADAGSEVSSTDGPTTTDAEPNPIANDARADGEPEAIDAGCGIGFPQEASFIDIGIIMGPTPDLSGGAIVAGTYELTAMRVYFGGKTGTMQVRETMRVRGSTTAGAFDRLTEARSATGSFQAYPLHGETVTWQTGAGPTLFHAPECPVKEFERGGRFDVNGDTLTLFDDQDAIERVYRRIH